MADAARLFVDADLSPEAEIALDDAAAHYLRHVLRLGQGAGLKLFNGRDGEFSARIAALPKRGAVLAVESRLRPFQSAPDIWLCFAPLRQGRMEILIEKATELNAARLVPLLTQHGQVRQVNTARLQAIAREAAEQCERLDLPEMAPLTELGALLDGWDASRRLYAAIEREAAPMLLAALQKHDMSVPAALLIGPEGGFAAEERALLLRHAGVQPVSLGHTILRAETAAIAALALYQGVREEGAGRSRP